MFDSRCATNCNDGCRNTIKISKNLGMGKSCVWTALKCAKCFGVGTLGKQYSANVGTIYSVYTGVSQATYNKPDSTIQKMGEDKKSPSLRTQITLKEMRSYP